MRQKCGNHIDEPKARAFFDKMIQLPFHMTMAALDTSGIVGGGLKGLGIDHDDLEAITRVAVLATGNNPRAIKRLVNSFILLGLVNRSVETPVGEGRSTDASVFAYMALQNAYPTFAHHLEARIDDAPDLLRRAMRAVDPTAEVDRQGFAIDMPDVPALRGPRR